MRARVQQLLARAGRVLAGVVPSRTTALDVVGAGLVVAGIALVCVPAALVVAGGACLAASRAMTQAGAR